MKGKLIKPEGELDNQQLDNQQLDKSTIIVRNFSTFSTVDRTGTQ